MAVRSLVAVATLVCGLAGCVPGAGRVSQSEQPQMAAFAEGLPTMRWDQRPEAANWTEAGLVAMAARDEELAAQIPDDIDAYCPNYEDNSLAERRAFWLGLMSALAKYESGWNPKAVGGGGRYLGLLQISPKTASHYSCETGELKDGAANLECGIKIIATQVGRDGLVAGAGNRGVARDWGPMMKAATRAQIAEWTRAQTYCKA